MKYDDIYKKALEDVWTRGIEVSPRGMKIKELLAYQFKIDDPRDNVITLPGFKTNVKYAEEELKWYYAATNRIDWSPLIERTWKQFSDDGKTVNSAYGHRIFGGHEHFLNQWEWCKDKLKDDPDSRQCVINLNDVIDKEKSTLDFICTVFCQVFLRENKLHWLTHLRSQDIYLGTRNDVYCFSEMQQQMAKEIGAELGNYYHYASSMHLYEKQFKKVKKLLEGEQ